MTLNHIYYDSKEAETSALIKPNFQHHRMKPESLHAMLTGVTTGTNSS